VDEPVIDPMPEPDPSPEPVPEPIDPIEPVTGEAQSLVVDKLTFQRKVTEAQEWGDGVFVSGFDVDGDPASLGYRSAPNKGSALPEYGFGVSGLRQNQQTGFDRDAGASEKIKIDFNGGVADLSFRVAHLGANEGPKIGGEKLPETGKWTALDAAGNEIATGKIGPDTSVDGLAPGTYGVYTFAVDAGAPIHALVLEATEYAHGESGYDFAGYSKSDSSEFSLQAVDYVRVDADAPTEAALAPLELGSDTFIFVEAIGLDDSTGLLAETGVLPAQDGAVMPETDVAIEAEASSDVELAMVEFAVGDFELA